MSKDGPAFSAARDLGVGWKVSPYINIEGKTTVTLAEINEPGAIQQIWMTTRPECWRNAVLRMFWDDEVYPSVEVPLGDFFCMGWKGEYHPVVSLPVAVNPMGGLNSYWEMPFHKNARITLENLDEIPMILFYQINACLTSVPEDAAQFHAQWRRSNPLPYKVPHTILDGVKGWGQYVGTYLAWGSNNNQWWGEGEIKFYLDGDQEYPTICGTGTEDYFCGAWGFETPKGQYGEFSSPYSGFWCVKTDGLNRSQTRFGMFRWHIMDPVRFEEDIRVTIQALGWRSGGRYLPLQDDIASTAFWYQNEPHAPFPPIPGKDDLEVI